MLILHAVGVGLIGRPAIISGRHNKCHSLQLQNHYAHFPPLQHTHVFMQNTTMRNWSWEMIWGFIVKSVENIVVQTINHYIEIET